MLKLTYTKKGDENMENNVAIVAQNILNERAQLEKELDECRKLHFKFKNAKELRRSEMTLSIARMSSEETEKEFGIKKMTDKKTAALIEQDQKYQNKLKGEKKYESEILKLEGQKETLDKRFELMIPLLKATLKVE